jgi:hypothetical protein
MGTVESTGTVEGDATKAWTTGDPEKDWARYQGQFDRTDRGLRQRIACLLTFDVLLLMGIALAGYGNATALWPVLPLFMFWGFVVSLTTYWAQYRAIAHRRICAERWSTLYPDEYPAPGGAECTQSGHISAEFPVLVPLISVVVWLLMVAYYVEESWSLMATRDLSRGMGALAGIAVVVALIKFLDIWAAFGASIDQDRNPPRKW